MVVAVSATRRAAASRGTEGAASLLAGQLLCVVDVIMYGLSGHREQRRYTALNFIEKNGSIFQDYPRILKYAIIRQNAPWDVGRRCEKT